LPLDTVLPRVGHLRAIPLSLRHVEELLAEREIDVSYENGSLLVEPLWPDIRGRNPEDAVRSVQRLYPLALVFG